METVWNLAISICGLGAIAALVFFLLNKQWLATIRTPILTKKQAYSLFWGSLIITFLALIAMLVTYAITEKRHAEKDKEASIQRQKILDLSSECEKLQSSLILLSENKSTLLVGVAQSHGEASALSINSPELEPLVNRLKALIKEVSSDELDNDDKQRVLIAKATIAFAERNLVEARRLTSKVDFDSLRKNTDDQLDLEKQHNFVKARLLLDEGKFGEAEKLFERSLTLGKKMFDDKVMLGISRILQGKFAKAKLVLLECLKISKRPDSDFKRWQCYIYQNLAGIELGQGNLEASLSYLELAMENNIEKSLLESRLGGILSIRAEVYQLQGKIRQAEKDILKSIELCNIDAGHRVLTLVDRKYRFAQILIEQGRLGEAEKQLNECFSFRKKNNVKKNPIFVSVMYSLGVVYQRQNNIKWAHECFDDCLKMLKTSNISNDETLFVCHNLGRRFIGRKGNLTKAAHCFEKAVDAGLKGSDSKKVFIILSESYGNLGMIHQIRKEFDVAKRHFQSAISVMENRSFSPNANLYFSLGMLEKDLKLKKQYFLKNIDLYKTQNPKQDTLAQSYMGLMQIEFMQTKKKTNLRGFILDAIEAQKICLPYQPEKIASFYETMADIDFQLGKFDLAEKATKQAILFYKEAGKKDWLYYSYIADCQLFLLEINRARKKKQKQLS